MSGKEDYDDDYLTKLLVEDAKNLSARYASSVPSRSNALRPNTRFLSNIVRDVDSHNTSLKKKEQLEARARLRRLQQSKERDSKHSVYERREDRKRRKYNHEEDPVARKDRRRENTARSRSPHKPRPYDVDSSAYQQRSRTNRYRDDKSDSLITKSHDTSPRRALHKTQEDVDRDSLVNGKTNARSSGRSHKRFETSGSKLNVLDNIDSQDTGSYDHQPHVRGRGAGRTRSHIDDHFSVEYDPAQDVEPASEPIDEGDDWAMALEVVRDRAMWKKKQTERLREAGWDDAQISKWKRGLPNDSTPDSDRQTVEWTKKGETRAWDVGKMRGADLHEETRR